MINEKHPISIGWYGKIPSLGDFVLRRLPMDFINPWDSWLEKFMTAGRVQLGERWLELYLTSPIWRFLIMPNTWGNSVMWTGVLMPSVDKAGRHFPLTIAAPVEPYPEMIFDTLSAQAWYASLEQAALASLDTDASPNDLDHRLSKCPFPRHHCENHSNHSRELASWLQNTSIDSVDHKTFTLPNADSVIKLYQATIGDIFSTMSQNKSFWWKVHFETDLTQLHCFKGLPSEYYFATLLGESEKN